MECLEGWFGNQGIVLSGEEPTTYRIDITSRAERDLKHLARQNRQVYGLVLSALRELAAAPRPQGCKPLVGQPGWRIRIGDYRVIYAIDDGARNVTVLGVAHRRDVYRRL